MTFSVTRSNHRVWSKVRKGNLQNRYHKFVIIYCYEVCDIIVEPCFVRCIFLASCAERTVCEIHSFLLLFLRRRIETQHFWRNVLNYSHNVSSYRTIIYISYEWWGHFAWWWKIIRRCVARSIRRTSSNVTLPINIHTHKHRVRSAVTLLEQSCHSAEELLLPILSLLTVLQTRDSVIVSNFDLYTCNKNNHALVSSAPR